MKKITSLDLTSRCFAHLPRSGGRKGFGAGVPGEKLFVSFIVFMPLVAIPVTLSKEVGGHAMVSDLRWDAPLSSI